jgi:hypothetical protein
VTVRKVIVVSILLASLGGLSCRRVRVEDPGYWRDPVGWVRTSDEHWSSEQGDFTLRTRSLVGLVGEWRLAPTFQVRDNAAAVTLVRAVLRTARGSYTGTIRSPSAPAGGGTLTASWDFDEAHPVPKVLGDRPEITLELLVGERPQVVEIAYERRGRY